MGKVMEHFLLTAPDLKVYHEGELCERCGCALPSEYDYFWCENCIPGCEHNETTYQKKEADTGLDELLMCDDCGFQLDINEPDEW